MTADELRECITGGEPDFEFGYKNKAGTICLCYLPKVYVLYDGVEFETTLDELMNAPILEGKSLNEAAQGITLYD